MASYKELKVWKKAIDLTVKIYQLCKYLPKEETYCLSDQMRRSAVSIASNIAEGQARNSTKDFIRFLYIAQGSRAELETQLEICKKLNFFPENEINITENLSSETGRMIRNLIRKLQHDLTAQTSSHQLPTTNYQPND